MKKENGNGEETQITEKGLINGEQVKSFLRRRFLNFLFGHGGLIGDFSLDSFHHYGDFSFGWMSGVVLGQRA